MRSTLNKIREPRTMYKRRTDANAKNRKEKPKEKMGIVRRFQLVFVARIPEDCRAKLMSFFSERNRDEWVESYCEMKGIKLFDWVIDKLWTRLPLETNQKVRTALLCIARELVELISAPLAHRTIDEQAVEALFATLEQDLLPSESAVALETMWNLQYVQTYESWNDEEKQKFSLRLIPSCLEALKKHCREGSNDFVLRAAISCLVDTVTEQTASLLVYDNVMPLLFEKLASADEDLEGLSHALSFLCQQSTGQDRISLFVRYFPLITESLFHFDSLDLVNLMEFPEYLAIVANTPSLLNYLADEMKKEDGVHYINFCEIALLVLENVLGDESKLENALGYGLLKVARRFAIYSYDPADSPDGTFTEILTRHPEWKSYFKKLTKDSQLPIGIMGRAIPDPRRLVADYVLLDEDITYF